MERKRIKKIVNDIISRKDPQGYYIIPAKKDALKFLKIENEVSIEDLGTSIIIKVKSRRIAERIARSLALKNLIEA